MPVRSHYFYRVNPPGSQVTLDAATLVLTGAVTPIEVHVPPPIASALAQQNPNSSTAAWIGSRRHRGDVHLRVREIIIGIRS